MELVLMVTVALVASAILIDLALTKSEPAPSLAPGSWADDAYIAKLAESREPMPRATLSSFRSPKLVALDAEPAEIIALRETVGELELKLQVLAEKLERAAPDDEQSAPRAA